MSIMTAKTTGYRLQEVREQGQWDQFVASQPGGHLLQSWYWGELKATAGWFPLRLGLWDGHRLIAGAQILRKSAPRVPLRLGHLAYLPKGPVLAWEQPELCSIFFAQMHRYLRKQGALALRMEPEIDHESEQGELVIRRLTELSFHPTRSVQPLRTILLNITPSEETLLAQMKEKWRYNVRLAGRKGVTIRVATSLEDIQSWYTLMQTTGERDQFGIHTLEYYQRAWQLFAPQGALRLLLAEREGQLLAGIFVSLFARQAIYMYGASSNEQRQLMPNYLLQWEAIRWAREQGAHEYDFWGIPETEGEEEAMAGVYRFKRGWGGRVVQFVGGYEYVYNPFLMKFAHRYL
ncbi:lipid II:glycine glycyltransferase FemX [Tengunoibacter tsumagoiensis]|uniref:Methicillin resistance protein n=1 Tax=Tengunoibacter tsumagoiensis TaxID=2014871 RepID=A0A401ZX07_9CHLR|nr:peptidoglycan bridge formation glycyltransferase FemA/FemB family protein [Tengunoibacter tsumagoiensis]GCE11398.1 methicillin resistance protein [Tengunoibacter tsumagoiensis]